MIEPLIDRIVNYQDPKIMPINQGSYYIEIFDDVTYMTSPESIISFYHNGKVIRLSLKCNNFEWKLHQDLYHLTKHDNNCRIEIPVDRKSIRIKNKEYHYFEIQRPNNELGIHFVDEILNSTPNTDYFLNYINDTAIVLGYIKKVLLQNNHSGVPRELLAPYKRNKDSLGYFWIDFKTWDFPLEKFIEKKIRTLYLTLLSIDSNFDYNTIMKKAEKEWRFFYE